MPRLTWDGTPRAILAELEQVGGKALREDVIATAKDLAGSQSTAAMALKRLQEQGLVVCEFRLTPRGKKALQGASGC